MNRNTNDNPSQETGTRTPLLTRVNRRTIKGSEPDNPFIGKDGDALERAVCAASQRPFNHGTFHVLHDYITRHQDIDAMTMQPDFYPALQPFYSEFQVDLIDSVALLMQYVAATSGIQSVFMDCAYDLKTGDGGVKVTSVRYDIVPSAMAVFLHQTIYRDVLIRSSFIGGHFYIYDKDTSSWRVQDKAAVEQSVTSVAANLIMLMHPDCADLNHVAAKVTANVLSFFRPCGDTQNLINQYSDAHPYYIQFEDVIYDMARHRMHRATPEFMVRQRHDYRLPSGALDQDTLTADCGWVDVPVSRSEMAEASELMLRRVRILHHDDEMPLVLTMLGNLFHRRIIDFEFHPFIEGGAGCGKSTFYNDIVMEGMLGTQNASALGQEDFEEHSRFTYSFLEGSNLNLMGELRGAAMRDSFVQFIKGRANMTKVEHKGRGAYFTKIQCRNIALCNKGQTPMVSVRFLTDDGLLRRIALLQAKTQEDITWMADFDVQALRAQIPAFSLLCMMTYMHHLERGDIRRLQSELGGVCGGTIDGFISQRTVDSTRRYLKKHDRVRVFLKDMFYNYVEDATTYLNRDIIIAHFGYLTSKTLDNMMMEFFRREFPDQKMTKERFHDIMETQHGITSRKRRIPATVSTRSDRRTCYGLKLGELIIAIIEEDDAASLPSE